MENLEQIFKIEALELINGLENSLVNLEQNPDDKKLIEKVFRIMHTLKGNCNMFGYETMGEFTHILETVFDLARNEKIQISKKILDVSLHSLDHLKNLLNDGKLANNENVKKHQELTNKIHQITNFTSEITTIPSSEEIKTFYILFRPNENVFQNGVNLLYTLNDLSQLGITKITPHLSNVPDVEALDPKLCYIYWDIYLATSIPKEKILEAFIFVQEDCKIDIHEVATGNLLEDNSFIDKVEDKIANNGRVDVNELKELAQNLLSFVKEQSSNISSGTVSKDAVTASIRVSSEKLDELMSLVSELVTTQAGLSLLAENSDNPELMAIAENIEKVTRRLRDNAFSICLVPIETMLTRFQRLVRDLSLELGKEVEFVTEGADTELDKSIIEVLVDPLLHILRNCLDHGLEDAETRIKAGKSKKGKILLKSYYSGASVMIEISDDGKGIDTEKVKRKAIERGLIALDENLGDKDILDLLFEPGFSTAEKVTEVSGRGVGMDVVKRRISDIRGEVWIETEKGKGTKMCIKLPLTLSIIDGLLVKVDETHFVIPLSAVHKCFEMPYETIDNKFNNVIILDGRPLPFIDLRKEFNIWENKPENLQMVLVKYEENEVGLCVDEIIGEYQAVLKSLGKVYKYIDIVSGATILGDGTIALVLDTNKIIKNFSELKLEEIS